MESLTLKRKPKVNLITMDSRVKDIIVTGMTCTDSKLLLSNCTFNTSILVLDDDAKYLQSIPSWHLPWDIAMIPGKNVAVATFQSQPIYFFGVDKMRLMKTKRTNETPVYGGRGITVTQSDMVLLGLSSAISILDVEGEEYSSIRFPDIKGFIDYLHMRDNGDNYMSNGEDVY